MKKNWLSFISEEDFLQFIGQIWGDDYSISNENVVDGHICERYAENYGRYFEVVLKDFFQDDCGETFSDTHSYRLGQFGAVDTTFDSKQNPCISDNIFPIKNINKNNINSTFLIAWIKFVAEKTNGIVNLKGQTYYEDLTQKVTEAVQDEKLALTREAEKKLRNFEAPFMVGLEKIGSNAPYTMQNRFIDASNELINFRANANSKKQREDEDSNFS